MSDKLIYCADCANCKTIALFSPDKATYIKKVQCSKEQWLYPSGKERLFEYHSLLQHRPEFCIHYDPMSENKKEHQEYIRHLQMTLPRDRVIYDAKTDKEVVYG